MSGRGVQATIAGGALVMAALVVAALSRPVPLMSRPVETVTFAPLPTITSSVTTVTTPPPTTTAHAQPFSPSPLLVALVQVVLVLAAVLLLVVLVQLLRSLLRRRPRLEQHEEPDFAIPAVPPELLEEARLRLLDLETGEPRNAIVAAWLGLESSAAATGLPRQAAETSSEYTERVLAVWPVDAERLADLAALYREARFSVHPLGEPHRDRAVADLRALIADLDRVAARQAAERGGAEADPVAQAGAHEEGS